MLPQSLEAATVTERLSAEGHDVIGLTPAEAGHALQAAACDLLIADAALAARHGLHTQGRSAPRTATILIGEDTRHREAASGRISCLSRPIDGAMLSCFVSMALLEARPARRSARKPVGRFKASANGVPSVILDVSAEGLRLEVPRDRGALLPPFFTVRVPLVGVSVGVRRMWTRAAPPGAQVLWYGGELTCNHATADRAWRVFVDTIPAAGTTTLSVES